MPITFALHCIVQQSKLVAREGGLGAKMYGQVKWNFD